MLYRACSFHGHGAPTKLYLEVGGAADDRCEESGVSAKDDHAGGLTDCACKNATTCGEGKKALWYCESTRGKQLSLDPYRGGAILY